MLRLHRLLFPTDFSDCAEGAYRHASYLAERFDAELHVLHVVEESDRDPGDWVATLQITPEDVAADLDLPVADRGNGEARTPSRFQSATEYAAKAGPAILRYARTHDIDLIVMGTHGRRGMRRLVMGSVAEEVVREAGCPVFTIGGGKACQGLWAIRRILAPTDFSEHAALATRHAAALADAYGATLDLLTVVDVTTLPTASVPYLGIFRVPTGELEDRAKALLRARAEALRAEFPGVERIGVRVHVGRPASDVVDVADAADADLVVVGSHGRSGLERLLMGSVAEEVVRTAPCPVFVVKSFGRSLLPARSERAEPAEALA